MNSEEKSEQVVRDTIIQFANDHVILKEDPKLYDGTYHKSYKLKKSEVKIDPDDAKCRDET
jgi:hypothetical protein